MCKQRACVTSTSKSACMQEIGEREGETERERDRVNNAISNIYTQVQVHPELTTST